MDLTELIPSLVEEDNDHLWHNFLKSCQELKAFSDNSGLLVHTVNGLLNEPSKRLHGLKILSVFLPQAPENLVHEHINHWLQQCYKSAAQPSKHEQNLSLSVLSQLLEVSFEFPDIRKQTSQLLIPRLLEALFDRLEDCSSSSSQTFECLLSLLTFYGKSCGNHREQLEKKLLRRMINNDGRMRLISKCFHMLAQVGAPGNDNTNYKDSWSLLLLRVIESMHVVLDDMFADIGEIAGGFSRIDSDQRPLDLPIIQDSSPLIKCFKLSKVFSALCQILQSMLLDKFPTSKKIVPEAIFGVVCRVLAVTGKSLQTKTSTSAVALMSELCNLHISVLVVLNALMLSSGTLLLSFTSLITELFIQIFKSTNNQIELKVQQKRFPEVREASYKCLLTWLSLAKSCSLVETQIEEIVKNIIKDIKCEKQVIKLNIQSKEKKSNWSCEVKRESDVNEGTCRAALACIPLIQATPIPASVIRDLQEVIVKLLFEIQRLLKFDKALPVPYLNASCRCHLYSALLSVCTSPHRQFPPPLHYANTLFSSACNDPDGNVRVICSQALVCLGHILRPCAPSFDIPGEPSEIIPINPYPEPKEKNSKVNSSFKWRKSFSILDSSVDTLPSPITNLIAEESSLKPKVAQLKNSLVDGTSFRSSLSNDNFTSFVSEIRGDESSYNKTYDTKSDALKKKHKIIPHSSNLDSFEDSLVTIKGSNISSIHEEQISADKEDSKADNYASDDEVKILRHRRYARRIEPEEVILVDSPNSAKSEVKTSAEKTDALDVSSGKTNQRSGRFRSPLNSNDEKSDTLENSAQSNGSRGSHIPLLSNDEEDVPKISSGEKSKKCNLKDVEVIESKQRSFKRHLPSSSLNSNLKNITTIDSDEECSSTSKPKKILRTTYEDLRVKKTLDNDNDSRRIKPEEVILVDSPHSPKSGVKTLAKKTDALDVRSEKTNRRSGRFRSPLNPNDDKSDTLENLAKSNGSRGSQFMWLSDDGEDFPKSNSSKKSKNFNLKDVEVIESTQRSFKRHLPSFIDSDEECGSTSKPKKNLRTYSEDLNTKKTLDNDSVSEVYSDEDMLLSFVDTVND